MLQSVVSSVAKAWPTFVWRGIFAFILAAVAFAYPGPTAAVLTYAFGAFLLMSGVSMLMGGFAVESTPGPWLAMVLFGLVSSIVGISVMAQPALGEITLAYTVALWAITAGVLEIFGAYQARNTLPNAWLWAVSGIVSIAAGALIAYAPGHGIIALSYVVGTYGTLFGIASIAFGIKLRSLPENVRATLASQH